MSPNAGQIVAMVMAAKQVIPSLLATLGNHNRAKNVQYRLETFYRRALDNLY